MGMRFITLLDRCLGAAINSSNGLASVCVFLMVLAVVADIFGRFLFNSPITGTTELVTMSVVVVLYLQLSYTLRSGSMTRSETVLAKLKAGRPRIGHGLNLLFCLAGAALMAAIMSAAWPKWLDAYYNNFYVGVAGVFTFPDWPRLLVIFVGCGLTGLQFFFLAAKSALAVFNPKASS